MENGLLTKGHCGLEAMTGKNKIGGIAVLIALFLAAPAESQQATANLTYADLADLVLPAPVTAHVRVTRAVRLKGDEAATVPAGKSRFYVEADMLSLIKGPGLPAKVSYLVDLPLGPQGKPPKIAKKSEYLVSAAPVPGRPGELQLAAADAQLAWTAQRADKIRRILSEASRPDAAPRITGIGRAFHVPGTLPGESETQIFLQTAQERPVSLSILRRPGERPRWSVALSEMVDDAAGTPAPDTLLWYRLACSLPAALPRQSLAEGGPAQANAIQADYRLVLTQLGPCVRNRARS